MISNKPIKTETQKLTKKLYQKMALGILLIPLLLVGWSQGLNLMSQSNNVDLYMGYITIIVIGVVWLLGWYSFFKTGYQIKQSLTKTEETEK